MAVYPKDPKFIVAILDDHINDPKGIQSQNVINDLCVINAEAKTMDIIVEGRDPTKDFFLLVQLDVHTFREFLAFRFVLCVVDIEVLRLKVT